MIIVAAIINAFLHLFAVVAAVGGSLFIYTVFYRSTKDLAPPQLGQVNQAMGQRFSMLVWISIAIIILTGVLRSVALGLFRPEVLFGTPYGNLLAAKIVLLAVIIGNSVGIARAGIKIANLTSAGGPPPADQIAAAQGRIKTLGLTNLTLGTAATFLAVIMRIIGAPTL